MSDKKRFSKVKLSNSFSSNKPGFVNKDVSSNTNRNINSNINRELDVMKMIERRLKK